MWNVLLRYGLDRRKLAVFSSDEASAIAHQICDDLGLICEHVHEEIVSGWLGTVSQSEPYQKRLRGEHQHDPLHDH